MRPTTHFACEALMTILALITLTIGTSIIVLSIVNVLSWGG